jgi:hypothetical protein
MKIPLWILFILLTLSLYAQDENTTDIIIDPIESCPVFPGGEDSLWCFLENSFHFDRLNSGNQKGRIYTTFVIDTSGCITDIKINPENISRLRPVVSDSVVENEVRRVLELMPPWSPASQMGKKVRCLYSLPVKIPYTNFRCGKNHDRILENPVKDTLKFLTDRVWNIEPY